MVIKFLNVGRGKYFSIVATVMADGVNVAELMIGKGLGYSYDGEVKRSWWVYSFRVRTN